MKKTLIATAVGMTLCVPALAATEFTGDKIDGVPVISKLDVSDLAAGKTHRFFFKGSENGIGETFYVPVVVAKGMNTIAYNTSKAAALHFARTLASEWGHYGIRVNAICPGFFPSKLANGLIEKLGPAMVERTPLRRIGGDEDLKGAVVFLASDASRHITGQGLVIDGGASLI